jgi:ribosomal protein L44E
VAANIRFDDLHDLIRRKANLRVECGTCEKVTIIDARRFARFCLLRGWSTHLSLVGLRLLCSRCGARPSRVRATPEQAGPDPFPSTEQDWKQLFRRLRD